MGSQKFPKCELAINEYPIDAGREPLQPSVGSVGRGKAEPCLQPLPESQHPPHKRGVVGF